MQFGYTTEEIYDFFKIYAKKIKYVDIKNILKLIYGVFFKRKIIIDGLNSGEIIENLINEKCFKKNIKNINQIKMPLAIPAVDIYTGNTYYFISQNKRKVVTDKIIYIDDINIGKAVRASCSYPVVFSPCKYNNKVLVDGGIRENIPWRETKNLGANKVLSVVFEKNIKEKTCDNIVDIVSNSISILNDELSNYEINGTDYLINIKTKKIGLLDMDKIDELYNLGYNEAKKQIKKLNII
ncbi:MAG: patatin-like phospholipase family protein [Clostridia bacterium]